MRAGGSADSSPGTEGWLLLTAYWCWLLALVAGCWLLGLGLGLELIPTRIP